MPATLHYIDPVSDEEYIVASEGDGVADNPVRSLHGRFWQSFSQESVSVSSSNLTQVAVIPVATIERLHVQVWNVGANALTGFAIGVRPRGDAPFMAKYDSAADFTAPAASSRIVVVSRDPTTLPGGSTPSSGAWIADPGTSNVCDIEIEVAGDYEIMIRAASTGGTLLTIKAGGN